MFKNRFTPKLPTDVSNKVSSDPNINKKPIIENTSNHKPEPFVTKIEKTIDYADAPVLVTEYKLTVQTKVEPSNQAHPQTRFSLGQQRRTSPPISAPMEKLVLGNENENEIVRDKPKNPTRDRNGSSQAKVEPAKDYKALNNNRDSPPSPVHSQIHGSPRKSYGYIDEKHDKRSTPVRDDKYKSPTRKMEETKNNKFGEQKSGNTPSSVQERPEKVSEFITEVQTEASQPTRKGPLCGKNWHNIGRADNDRYARVVEPYVEGKNGWEGAAKREWGMTRTQVAPILGPTDNIGEALNNLKEAVYSAPPPQNKFNYMDPRISQRDAYRGYIDSTEAQRRYGNPSLGISPFRHPTVIITSTEAAEKYGGAPV